MPVGITTDWTVDRLGCFSVNGFVDHVYYRVDCKEWVQIEENKTGSGDPVGIGTTNVNKTLDANHTHHAGTPRTSPTGVGQTQYVHSQKTLTGKHQFDWHTDTIVPYEDLTESQIIGWVKTGLGTTNIERLESSIRPEITQYGFDATRVVRVGDALPWK
mgnify:FL=1|tara:strand:- start:66 stop:542 length:477 start_codon:yes stop_codon:yes gene_type:complete